jgi:hypothetical protein
MKGGGERREARWEKGLEGKGRGGGGLCDVWGMGLFWGGGRLGDKGQLSCGV